MNFEVCLLWICLCSISTFAEKRYDGFMVISAPITSRSMLEFIDSLPNVDLLHEARQAGDEASLLVAPDNVQKTLQMLKNAGIEARITTPNIQDLIDGVNKDLETNKKLESRGRSFRLSSFHSHGEINNFLKRLAKNCKRRAFHNDVSCDVITIGQSYEGRDLDVLHIHPTKNNNSRPAIWIDAGIHAREWAAPATAIYVIYKLLSTANNPVTHKLLTSFDWYILPSANPDGYEFSITSDRLWRKTRRPNENADCYFDQSSIGTDPNRNWDFHWMENGTSSSPCHQTYGGESAFSEPETKAMSDFLLRKRGQILIYLSLHSYGQYWLMPWGHTTDTPEDYDELVDVANAGVDGVRKGSGKDFLIGSPVKLLYAGSGDSMDWAKGVAGIKYAYTIELRDQGEYGFIMPTKEIVPSGKEIWRGIRAMMMKLLDKKDNSSVN